MNYLTQLMNILEDTYHISSDSLSREGILSTENLPASNGKRSLRTILFCPIHPSVSPHPSLNH